jgi:hypothetical protein
LRNFEKALDSQRKFWFVLGVLGIIVVVLAGLMLLLLLASGLGTSVVLPPESAPILLVGTLFIQFSGNRILYGLGKKTVPW